MSRPALPALILRTYARYAVPVTVVSALVFAPILALALRVPVPGDAGQVGGVLRTTWLLAALSLGPLLVLVGGVAPAVRGIASGAPPGQLAILRAGVVSALGAAIPVGFAVAASLVGALALVLPGVALLVLLALTGATTGGDVATRLAASVTAARANLVAVLVILAVAIAIAVGALALAQRGLPMPLPKAPKPELLAAFRMFARVAAAGLALAAPLPAIALAAVAVRAGPSART